MNFVRVRNAHKGQNKSPYTTRAHKGRNLPKKRNRVRVKVRGKVRAKGKG